MNSVWFVPLQVHIISSMIPAFTILVFSILMGIGLYRSRADRQEMGVDNNKQQHGVPNHSDAVDWGHSLHDRSFTISSSGATSPGSWSQAIRLSVMPYGFAHFSFPWTTAQVSLSTWGCYRSSGRVLPRWWCPLSGAAHVEQAVRN